MVFDASTWPLQPPPHEKHLFHSVDPSNSTRMTPDDPTLPQAKRQRTNENPVVESSTGPTYTSVHDQGPQGNPFPPPTEPSIVHTPVQTPRRRLKQESPHAPHAAELYNHAQTQMTPEASGLGRDHYAPSTAVPRLPPILQVEKQQVTTSATQMASASRRRNEAHFVCPVPGCGSTFTRRFNLRGD